MKSRDNFDRMDFFSPSLLKIKERTINILEFLSRFPQGGQYDIRLFLLMLFLVYIGVL